MKQNDISKQRMFLKQYLASTRTVFTADGYKPVCAYCDEPIFDGMDMHEVLLTRGDVQGNSNSLTVLVMNEFNCALVHTIKCHIEAATKEGQKKCIHHLIKWAGKKDILFWLTSVAIVTKSSVAKEAYRLVEGEIE
jgi:hypothetical protein